MLDMKLLKAVMDDRNAYERVQAYVDSDELSPQAGMWWRLVQQWYEGDHAALGVDPDILRARGKRSLPEKYAADLLDWFDDLPNVPSAENVIREALLIKLHNAKNEMARLAATPDADPDALNSAILNVQHLMGATSLAKSETKILDGDYMEDFEVLDESNKIQLAPRVLNSRCKGGAVGGDHIVLFGPTEVGKSLFCINLAAHFLRTNKRALYIGNEDNIHKIRMRLRANLSNMTDAEMAKNPKQAIKRAEQKGMVPDNLIMAHMKPGYVSEIDELAADHKPKIIVIDQFRNLGGAGDGMTHKMNENAIHFRSVIAKHNCVGVSVAQANAGEYGKPQVWFTYDQIDSSRTGLPAQADLLVGIGADEEMLARGVRAISLCKNKLGDNHEGFLAKFDHAHSRVTT